MVSTARVTLAMFVISIILLFGCSKKETFREEVEIIKISGTLPHILSSTGALLSNDSVKIGEATLILTTRELSGHIRTLEVLDGNTISKSAVLSRICIGSKFSMTFIKSDLAPEELAKEPTYYIGKLSADDILLREFCQN